MTICLFTENYQRGGVDTFIINFINNWPNLSDTFVLVCNEDHPGLQDIRERLHRPCRIVTHRILTYKKINSYTAEIPFLDFFRKALSPIVRYLFFVLSFPKLRMLLCDDPADYLMVINGGYPGGDTCRAAGIVWGLYSQKPPSIHNFHNLATPPRHLIWFQENWVDRLLARYTKIFITVSQAAADSMSNRPAIPSNKVTHVYNGLELSGSAGGENNIRRELGVADHTPLCLMLGIYEPRKGHFFLLQVFRRVLMQIPEAHFVICGHGSDQEIAAVEKMVAELELGDSVHLLGFRSDANQILSRVDLLLVGSQEFESFGLTCVEAMMHRVPVVATRVGGLPEVVVDGEGGFTFEKDDVEGYAGQVATLLVDKNMRAEQGNKGFERYQELFTADRMANEYSRRFGDC